LREFPKHRGDGFQLLEKGGEMLAEHLLLKLLKLVFRLILHLLPERELMKSQAHDIRPLKSFETCVVVNDAGVFMGETRAVDMVGVELLASPLFVLGAAVSSRGSLRFIFHFLHSSRSPYSVTDKLERLICYQCKWCAD